MTVLSVKAKPFPVILSSYSGIVVFLPTNHYNNHHLAIT